MVISLDRICKVYSDDIIVIFIVFSLFDIYLCRFNISSLTFSSYFNSITFKYSLRIHIFLITFWYVIIVSIDPPIELKQPKSYKI